MGEQGVQVLRSRPAQSPDLSVIENIREYLKDKTIQRNPGSREDLWKVAEEDWNDPFMNQSQGD